jgi:molybdenum cofactor cytidylyltransferase
MGRPKQLLPVGGRPLLRRVAEAALAAPVSPVIVVLGAQAMKIAPCLDGLDVHAIVHAAWAEGMGSSLRAGMREVLRAAPQIEAVIVALADRPDFSATHAAQLIVTHARTGRSIVASESGGTRLPPVLFGKKHFPELLALSGEAGARAVIEAHPEDVATVPLAAAAADLDTPEDYERFLYEHL